MSPRGLLLSLLVLASVVADLAALKFAATPLGPEQLPVALGLAQATVLAWWMMLGRLPFDGVQPSPGSRSPVMTPWQFRFSLAQLMRWTTATILVLNVGRWLWMEMSVANWSLYGSLLLAYAAVLRVAASKSPPCLTTQSCVNS